MPKLYFGSRGGLYYRKKGRKVYDVTNRFGAVPSTTNFSPMQNNDPMSEEEDTSDNMSDDESTDDEEDLIEITKFIIKYYINTTIVTSTDESRTQHYINILNYIKYIVLNEQPIQIPENYNGIVHNIIRTLNHHNYGDYILPAVQQLLETINNSP